MEVKSSLKTQPYCKMRENLVLSTNTKCMKAEVLFVEDSKEIEHPIKTNWKTEQKKKKKKKKS